MELTLTVPLSPHLTVDEVIKLQAYCRQRKVSAESLTASLIKREIYSSESGAEPLVPKEVEA